jgi:hypothetical protein
VGERDPARSEEFEQHLLATQHAVGFTEPDVPWFDARYTVEETTQSETTTSSHELQETPTNNRHQGSENLLGTNQ